MLFDLQSPRRRRVVQIVFGTLAAVFAISFVFFGVGTGGIGGIGDLLGSGGGGSDASSAFDDDIEEQEKKLTLNPNDTAALAELVQLHYSAGIQNVDENGALTNDGEQDLQQSADAWNKYVKVSRSNVDPGVALVAYQMYYVLAQAEFGSAAGSSSSADQLQSLQNTVAALKGAAEAQRVVVVAQPNVASWQKVAEALYLAGDAQGARQAIAEAEKVDPAAAAKLEQQLKTTQEEGATLARAITQLTKQQQAGTGGATGGGATPLPGLEGGGLGGAGALGGG
ncbi:MAG TPA: hypothetical protein VF052_06010 [Solirubrobacterales bacterium]